MTCLKGQQLTLTPGRQEEHPERWLQGWGPREREGAHIHKLWGLEKVTLPLWACFTTHGTKELASVSLRVLSHSVKTPHPRQWLGGFCLAAAWGQGQEMTRRPERGEGSATALRRPRSTTPTRTR